MRQDDFYNDENLRVLRKSIKDLEEGSGQEHELIDLELDKICVTQGAGFSKKVTPER